MGNSASTKKVVVNSIIYTFSGLLLKCFVFFLLPLYTAYLTTEDYGITSIANSFISTMGYIVALSLFSAVMRFYVDIKEDKEKLRRFYGTISLFTFLSSAFFFIVLTILRVPLSDYVFSGMDYFPVIMICLISLVFYCQYTIFDNILRSQQKAMSSSILSIAFFFITLGFNIYFVVVLKMGAVGSLLATLIAYAGCSIILTVTMICRRQIKYCLDFGLLKEALKYSLPILPHNLSTSIAFLVSKVIIGDVVSLSSLGVYTVASQFGNISDTVQGYVDQAYGPWLYEILHAKEENYKKTIRNITRALIAVIGLFFVAISLFAQDYIVLFININYRDAWRFVPLIVIVFAIKTMYYFYVEILFYYKEAAKMLFLSTLTSSIINVLLSFFLIKDFGVYGSIMADAIAMLLRVAIIVLISRRFEDIGIKIHDFILNFIVVAIFIFLGLSLSYFKYGNSFSIVNFGYKLLVILIYITIYAFIFRNQLSNLFKLVKTKIKYTRK